MYRARDHVRSLVTKLRCSRQGSATVCSTHTYHLGQADDLHIQQDLWQTSYTTAEPADSETAILYSVKLLLTTCKQKILGYVIMD